MFEFAYVEQAPAAEISYEEIEEIRVEGTACMGACPRYIASIQPDDSYRFCGLKFAGVDGPQTGALPEHSFQALLQTVRDNAFLNRNSVESGKENCTIYITDGPGAHISVSFTNGETRRVYWYAGCQIENDPASADNDRPFRLSDDALALSTIMGHARELLIGEGLLPDPDNMAPIPREAFWTPDFPREDCGFDE